MIYIIGLTKTNKFCEVFFLKKAIAILLSIIVIVSSFAACASKKGGDNGKADSTADLVDAVNEYGFETVEVTDKNGKSVTNKNGEKETTQVAVLYEKDKKGKTVAKVLDDNGDVKKDKNGKEVTVKTDYKISDSETTKKSKNKKSTSKAAKVPTTKKQSSSATTTEKTNGKEATTKENITTLPYEKDKVPTFSEAQSSSSKKAVEFDSYDQQIVKGMLEVPYLYTKSYENEDGVPIDLATHAALWMAEREDLNTSTYASGTIVLDLFKFFGQTVVNFKSKCNDDGKNDNIKYNSKNDTFTISNFENPTHTVSIEKIEFLGNNNYYLVTGSVSGCSKSKVLAIVQKNKLDIGLGFSIKALKWS